MQWLPFLVLCVWISKGACILECYTEECRKCYGEEITNEEKNGRAESCKVYEQLAKCGTIAAIRCNTNFVSEAKKLQSVAEEMCEKGTFLNIEKNSECLTQSAAKCTNIIPKMVGENLKPEEVLNFQKEWCRRIDATASCTTEKVRQNCPSDVLTDFKTWFNPSTELNRKICGYILQQVPSDHTTKGNLPMFHGPLELFI